MGLSAVAINGETYNAKVHKVLAQVRATLHIQAETSCYVNVGIDRPNIAWFVRHMKGGKKDLDSLDFLLPTSEKPELEQTMVFFDDINISLDALKWFLERLPLELHSQVEVYNSRRSSRSKKIVIDKFRNGEIKYLLTTEAAGMGCDIPNVEQVVQFMVPASLSIWMQRAGRAGRNIRILARAILLVQPSVFQEMRVENVDNEPNDGEVKYRKDVEQGLREWIETVECRREAAAVYFDDRAARFDDETDNEIPTQSISNQNGKRTMEPSVPNRRGPHLQGARDLLQKWRSETWRTLYCRRLWGIQCLLPDAILTAFATKARLRSREDLIAAGWSPTHCEKHGLQILHVLKVYDDGYWGVHQEEKAQRLQAVESNVYKHSFILE
ncbi:hypothetical protein H0H81_008858 [Sphagnurus paluster]|uniref:DNA 3'-5' helicase n=1 Tax=Sphagnurus paluster TaxID=117069 RepID=A0A9P7GIR5_9AGAR|nr:hypothetical protein H0H81_008858 [Sphagnurus paluster]